MSIDVSQFHQVFFEESFEGLDAMEIGLLTLEEGIPDIETINTIFRAAHSIKGGAGTFGFMVISDFTHHLETLLDEIRNGKRTASHEAITVSLEAVDVLRETLNAVQTSTDINQSRIDDVTGKLQALLIEAAETELVSTETTPAKISPPEVTGWQIHFSPHMDMLQTGNDPVRLIHELSELGKITVELDESRLPSLSEIEPEDCYLQWTIELIGNVDKATILEVFDWVEDDCELSITPLITDDVDEQKANKDTIQSEQIETPKQSDTATQTDNNKNHQPAEVATDQSSPTKTKSSPKTDHNVSSIRVGTDKVDSLINLVGELVITQSMLSQVGTNFDSTLLPKLLDGLEQLERNTRELQDGIMRIRMLPISFTFNRFPRLVHDLSSKLGKKVELKLTGEQTELDKTVMEKISDPLVHLVRNSMDHGLETPEVRIAAGKSETGLLHLNAYHQGGNIVIEIEDDGAGLNDEKIFNKAVENGLVSETDNLSPEQIHELIFMPGFSTAESISDVSGRGVGMDVVRKNIHSLGGTIDVASEKGRGSRFTIRLPLTLAIMDGQIIQVEEQKYIIPLVSIIESVEIKSGTVKSMVGKGEVYKLRDEYIPIIRLHEVFALNSEITNLEGNLLVIVENESNKFGLLVDDLLSQQQIVIKSLETNYKNVTGLSGATILGDGMVALILDVAGLMTMYRTHNNNKIQAA